MAGKTTSPIDAVRAIYEALEPLDGDTRSRAIASAMSLLGMQLPDDVPRATQGVGVGTALETDIAQPVTPVLDRPQSLVEVMQEKVPATNAQKIAVFAFYRERVQGVPRFSRRDLEPYFADAREAPPGNYDRDFNQALGQGWIHEDGEQSYLTTKGIEAVEAGFGGRRTPSSSSAKRTSTRGKSQRKRTPKSSKRKATKSASSKKASVRRTPVAKSKSQR